MLNACRGGGPVTVAVRLQLYRMANSPNTSPVVRVRRSRPAWVTWSSPPGQKDGWFLHQLQAIRGPTRDLTCYDVHAVSFRALFDDMAAQLEVGDG